jgi:flagellar hook-length control protein FliK
LPPALQQPEPSRQAGAVRVDAGPVDRVQTPAVSTGPAAPDATEPSLAKPSPDLAAAAPPPADPGADALLHAAAGQGVAAAAAPSTAQARAAVPADARAAPSAATAQVMPAMVSLVAGVGGSHSMTLRLDPASLGAVQIRIDRSADAPARVDISADRPETLALLQGDQHHLQQALDQAGVPAEGRQLTFHAATPSSDGSAQPSRSDIGSGGSGQGQAGQHGPGGRRGQGGAGGEAVLDGIAMPIASGWLRAGIDITA